MQLDEIEENRFIDAIASSLPSAKSLESRRHESDAEIIGVGDIKLAMTTDSISEELSSGLYDPYLGGWILVVSNLSDLAAVGAKPIGLELSLTIPSDWDIDAMVRGIAGACKEHGCGILGGDTNIGEKPVLGATAIGTVEGRALPRMGIKPGEAIYTTGRAGLGNAFALARMSGMNLQYKPEARIKEGLAIRDIAGACMDTSDGLLATVDQLARINGIGIDLLPVEEYVHPIAMDVAKKAGVNPLGMIAGIHGDFELVFSMPEDVEPDIDAILIGYATKRDGIRIDNHEIPTAEVRNAYFTSSSIEEYLTRLRSLLD